LQIPNSLDVSWFADDDLSGPGGEAIDPLLNGDSQAMDELITEAQKEVWEVVRRINAAWLDKETDRLLELFHDRIVIVGAEGRRYGEGKTACVDSYQSFCEQAAVTLYHESDRQVDVYSTVAVVGYRFEIEYTMGGKTARDTGRDLFVLEKENGRWQAVWRQLVEQPA
jgi:hypothetical protein